MSTKIKNQHTDSFKLLSIAAKSINNLNTQVTNVLNRLLPSRILSTANIFNISIDVAQDLATMIMLHVEDSLVENNILIAQKELSVRGLATYSGHHAVRPISSTGMLKLVFSPAIQLSTPKLIINNPIFRCAETNLTYTTISKEQQIIPSSVGQIFMSVIEGSWVTRKFVSEGLKLETLRIDDLQPIEYSHVNVYVNGLTWKQYDALYDMGSETQGYYLKNGISNQIDVCFGDNVHGKQLTEGDSIIIEYLTTSGESGNCSVNAEFKSVSGFYNAEGVQIDISPVCKISVENGFQLGSNGESIEKTRQIAGMTSRSLVFARPENLKAFLSRLSVINHINVWTEQDDLVFNMMLLPNIKNVLGSYRDYLSMPLDKFTLTDIQKSAIIEYIDSSKSQATSSEILIHDPVFERYAIFVYVQTTAIDKQLLKERIESNLAEVFLQHTFFDTDLDATGLISQTELIDKLWEIENIQQLTVDLVSERNELARINKFYEIDEVSYVGSVKRVERKKIIIDDTINPKLGFDELGGVKSQSNKHIPLLRGGFKKWNSSGNHVDLEKPIYIFYKTINGYEELQ